MIERIIYNSVVFDDLGFRPMGRLDTRVEWSHVRRVALGHQTDDALDAWYFWAFQTDDPNQIIEVPIETVSTMHFDKEIHRRFNVVSVPLAKDFADTKFPICTYIVYPVEELGQALYSVKRRRWCFWMGDVSFTKPMMPAIGTDKPVQ